MNMMKILIILLISLYESVDKKEIIDYKATVKLRKDLSVPVLSRATHSSSSICEKDFTSVLHANFSSFLPISSISNEDINEDKTHSNIPICTDTIRNEVIDSIDMDMDMDMDVHRNNGNVEVKVGDRDREWDTDRNRDTDREGEGEGGTGITGEVETRSQVDSICPLWTPCIHSNDNDKSDDTDDGNDNSNSNGNHNDIDMDNSNSNHSNNTNGSVGQESRRKFNTIVIRSNTNFEIYDDKESSSSSSSSSSKSNTVTDKNNNRNSRKITGKKEITSVVKRSIPTSTSTSRSSAENVRINQKSLNMPTKTKHTCNICNNDIKIKNSFGNIYSDDKSTTVKCESCQFLFHKKCCDESNDYNNDDDDDNNDINKKKKKKNDSNDNTIISTHYICKICATMSVIFGENGNENGNENGKSIGTENILSLLEMIELEEDVEKDVEKDVVTVQSKSVPITNKKRSREDYNISDDIVSSGTGTRNLQELKKDSNKKVRTRTQNQELNKSTKDFKKSKNNSNSRNKDPNDILISDNNIEDNVIHPDVLAALQACESFEFT